MAGSTRLELAASAVTGRRSNQLNYDPAISLITRLLHLPVLTVTIRTVNRATFKNIVD